MTDYFITKLLHHKVPEHFGLEQLGNRIQVETENTDHLCCGKPKEGFYYLGLEMVFV